MQPHMAIPCCSIESSVSTWAPENALNRELDQSRVVIPVSLLIRWVKSIVSGIWQRTKLFASLVGNLQSGQGLTRNAALCAEERTTYTNAKNDGTGLTRSVVTTKVDQITMRGKVADLLPTTSALLENTMGMSVSFVRNQECWYTTRMAIDPTTNHATCRSCVNAAIRSMYMTVRGTFLSSDALQRYSQYPRKLGINTLNYGEGSKKLSKKLGVDVDKAKELIEKYFAPYPKVRQFIQDTHRLIRTDFMVETILGRPRRFPEMQPLGHLTMRQLYGNERGIVAQCERQSVNAIIQGSAADVARLAMIKCEFDPELKNLGVEMLLQIHDELIFEVPIENVQKAVPIIRERMEHPFEEDLSVPLGVDMGSGFSWASAKG